MWITILIIVSLNMHYLLKAIMIDSIGFTINWDWETCSEAKK